MTEKIKKYNIFYYFKMIMFILFLVAVIKIVPSMFEIGVIGIVFLVLLTIYIGVELVIIALKRNNIKTNIMVNLMGITLYVYVILLAIKYMESVNNVNYTINPMYFKINYTIALIGIIGIAINQILLLFEEDQKFDKIA